MSEEILIQKTILEMEKPFRIVDLLLKLKGMGITDKNLIFKTLNNLLNRGLVLQSDIMQGPISNTPTKYQSAFMAQQ